MTTVGILGGTFDPPHAGHLAIARAAREELRLDEVALLPARLPPHKEAQAAPEERLAMCRLLAEREPGVTVSDAELRRAGPTFTVDTLEALRAERPDADIVYIIGADTLFELTKWRDFARVTALCRFAVAGRPGYEGLEERRAALEAEYGARIDLLNVAGPRLSSTGIRAAVREGRDANALLTPAVAEYAAMRGLYRDPWSLGDADAYLKEHLSEHRYRHSLGVRDTARELALHYHLDEERAALAGLGHDIAKQLSVAQQLAAAARYGLALDKHELQAPDLIHGRVGAEMAREAFAWRDQAVLEAIAWHVTGRPGDTDLAIAVKLADIIEPGRGFPLVERVREAARQDLYGGMACALARIATFILWDLRVPMHPVTIEFYNEMLVKSKEAAT